MGNHHLGNLLMGLQEGAGGQVSTKIPGLFFEGHIAPLKSNIHTQNDAII